MAIAKKVLEDAMQLSEAERASLAAELLDSISAPDPRTEVEWIGEVERRAKRALASDSAGDSTIEDAVARIKTDLDL